MSQKTGTGDFAVAAEGGAGLQWQGCSPSHAIGNPAARAVRVNAPGRTELAGNHVDHQGGRAITATVDRYVAVEAVPNGTSTVRVMSDGFPAAVVDCADLTPRPEECLTEISLVRGVLAGMSAAGVPVGGFDARVTSDLPVGRGLSSSAAFELALVDATVALFGGGADVLDPVAKADIALAAERAFFGKPCGAMDQRAIAFGGIVAHDFSRAAQEHGAIWERVDFDFAQAGYTMFLVDTFCDHSLYTQEYSLVVTDMTAVANYCEATVLGELPREDFLARLPEVRRELGDQPALRALHYYHEMDLVDVRRAALEQGDMAGFLQATRLSGASSASFLQNVSTTDRRLQPAMVALAAVQTVLGTDGACRIHGGGFGGTVQAFVPMDKAEAFRARVDAMLGAGASLKLGILR